MHVVWFLSASVCFHVHLLSMLLHSPFHIKGQNKSKVVVVAHRKLDEQKCFFHLLLPVNHLAQSCNGKPFTVLSSSSGGCLTSVIWKAWCRLIGQGGWLKIFGSSVQVTVGRWINTRWG